MRQPNAADDSDEPATAIPDSASSDSTSSTPSASPTATPTKDTLGKSWRGEIRSLAQDGVGVGTIEMPTGDRVLRRPIFVPFTAPGDHVEATIGRTKGKYAYGTLKSIITPSPHRVQPPCPHFTICGGCNLEHVAYDEQVRQKEQMLQFLLDRRGIVLPHPVKVIASPTQHHYRKRSKIAVRFNGKSVIAGFRRHHSHDVIAVHECFIVSPEMLAFITLINNSPPEGELPPVTVELLAVSGESGKLGVLVLLEDVREETRPALRKYFDDVYGRNRHLLGNLFFEEEHGEYHTEGQVQEHLSYRLEDLHIAFSPEVFIQANTGTNSVLVERVIDMVLATSDETIPNAIIDLYCGIGNFSLPLALHAKQVVGVEGNKRAIDFAQVNAVTNNIVNARFFAMSVEEYLHQHTARVRNGKYDDDHPAATHIIIDPPRTGCTPPVLQGMLASGVPNIIYVSCDPPTLAADLIVLSEKYVVNDIVGVDMFPDTGHLETVVLLNRK